MEEIIREVKKLTEGLGGSEEHHFVIYTKDGCPYCDKAFRLLESYGFSYTEVNVTKNEESLGLLKGAGLKTVPQIFTVLGEKSEYIGGFVELKDSLVSEELKSIF